MSLHPFEQRWAAAIARALVPAGALDGVVDAVDLGARYAEEHAASPWHVALLMRASLWLAWLLPVWLGGRLRSFGGVDEATRVALLERMLGHRSYAVRMIGTFLKLTLCTLLFGDTATLRALGAYDLGVPPAQPPAPLHPLEQPHPLGRRSAS